MASPVDSTAEETLKRFWIALTKHALGFGWAVGREMDGRSNRGFILQRGDREIQFFVKVSQSERAFWGLPPEKAADIVQSGREALVLLTGPFSRYVITSRRLRELIPLFSIAKEQGDYKINEGKVKTELPFKTIVKLWSHLETQII